MNELEIVQYHQLEGLNVFINTVSYRSPHFHNEWELLWVLDAPLKVTWQQQDILLQPGDLALFPPKLAHEFEQTEGICTFLCLQISPALLVMPTGIVTEDIVLKNHLFPDTYRKARQFLLEIAECYFYREPMYELQCLGKSALMMHMMLQSMPIRTMTAEEAANEDLRNARLMRLTQYVEENYTHKIRLADFAQKEGCSVSYLSHFIKNTMNQTFQDYVNSVRFRKACKLIAEGKESMISISMESGFSDYRYFSRAFQEYYGMTPAEYRRKANTIVTGKSAQSQSAHSQERFLTKGQSIGILQEFRKQHTANL